jgi:aspartyl aminopeptidase
MPVIRTAVTDSAGIRKAVTQEEIMIRENAWTLYNDDDLKALEKLSADYIDFLNNGKTERECTERLVEMARKNGYRDLDEVIRKGEKLGKGDKIYAVNMGKALMMLNIGEDIINDGMNVLGAHLDSPRLDIKQNPLYESEELGYLNTHYYGGIKKYLYVALPLALHGVVIKPDGTKITISIGEDDDDPVFFVSDLLIHLAQDQMKLTASEVVKGEDLDILVEKTLLWFRENAYKKERLGAAIDRIGVDAFEAAIATDDLIARKDAILAAELKDKP